jgi:hypothetical protein
MTINMQMETMFFTCISLFRGPSTELQTRHLAPRPILYPLGPMSLDETLDINLTPHCNYGTPQTQIPGKMADSPSTYASK